MQQRKLLQRRQKDRRTAVVTLKQQPVITPKMQEVVLCDGNLKIAIRANRNQAILSIANGEEIQFPMSKSNLHAILDGETIQFSHQGIFCKLSRSADDIKVVYAWKGVHDSSKCPASELENLVKHLDVPDEQVAM